MTDSLTRNGDGKRGRRGGVGRTRARRISHHRQNTRHTHFRYRDAMRKLHFLFAKFSQSNRCKRKRAKMRQTTTMINVSPAPSTLEFIRRIYAPQSTQSTVQCVIACARNWLSENKRRDDLPLVVCRCSRCFQCTNIQIIFVVWYPVAAHGS